MLNKLILGAFLCALGTGIVLYVSQNANAEDTLTLGTMSGWPPFVSINKKGAYEGLDIVIANEIARRLGKKLVIKDMDTAALITALDQGTVDFIMTGLDITVERLKKISMIPYQGEPMMEFPLIFWKTIPQGIRTLDDLKNYKDSAGNNAVICIEAGSSQEEILRQYSGFEMKYTDPLASVLEIKFGRALAMLSEKKLFLNLQKKYPELVALMVPLSEKNIILGCGIGVKKDNSALTQQIRSVIEDLKKSGFLAETEKRWFTKESS